MNLRSSKVRIFDNETIDNIILKIILYPLTILKKKMLGIYIIFVHHKTTNFYDTTIRNSYDILS